MSLERTTPAPDAKGWVKDPQAGEGFIFRSPFIWPRRPRTPRQGPLPSRRKGGMIWGGFRGAGRPGGARAGSAEPRRPERALPQPPRSFLPRCRLSGQGGQGEQGVGGGFLRRAPRGRAPEPAGRDRRGPRPAGLALLPSAAAAVARVTGPTREGVAGVVGACGPARSGQGGGGRRCLVAMGTAPLFPTSRQCQWSDARARGYCRTAAICRGPGRNNVSLL